MNQQKAAMQQLWINAFRADKPLVINCESTSEARRFRFAMYDAVKETRKPDGAASETLREAVENCSLSYGEEDKTTIVIRKKSLSGIMQQIAAILGPDMPKEEDEIIAAEESGKRLMERLGQEAPVKKNPYY